MRIIQVTYGYIWCILCSAELDLRLFFQKQYDLLYYSFNKLSSEPLQLLRILITTGSKKNETVTEYVGPVPHATYWVKGNWASMLYFSSFSLPTLGRSYSDSKKIQRNGNAALHRIYAPISLNKFPHFTELGPDLEMIPASKPYT